MSTTKTVTVNFEKVRETRGAARYQEVTVDGRMIENYTDPECLIGTLYIRRSLFNGHYPPVKVSVTVEYESD